MVSLCTSKPRCVALPMSGPPPYVAHRALASEGLLGRDEGGLPAAVSDRGTQMHSRSFKEFLVDLART